MSSPNETLYLPSTSKHHPVPEEGSKTLTSPQDGTNTGSGGEATKVTQIRALPGLRTNRKQVCWVQKKKNEGPKIPSPIGKSMAVKQDPTIKTSGGLRRSSIIKSAQAARRKSHDEATGTADSHTHCTETLEGDTARTDQENSQSPDVSVPARQDHYSIVIFTAPVTTEDEDDQCTTTNWEEGSITGSEWTDLESEQSITKR
jgi:hypothetical protein